MRHHSTAYTMYVAHTHTQSFGDWDEDYNAHTYQAGQIMEVLDLYIGMTKRGQIEQAPSHPRQ